MTNKTWLYLYENRGENRLYVGIADRLDRVWQPHNHDAERLREAVGTQILQTIQPFSSRDDALKAEAIAIHVAMLSGMTVSHAPDEISVDVGKTLVTNRAGVVSTSVLGPAVKRRDGSIAFDSLRRTAIVTISSNEMDSRRGPYGGTESAQFSQRAQKWWKVAVQKQSKIERLIAILSGAHGIILGDWDVDSTADYGVNGDVFPLLDPASDDPRGIKGMRLVGMSGQSGQIYSADLRG